MAITKVTLSFDNGPDLDTTPKVLDILARHGVRSTFFVVGNRMVEPARRALAERAHAEGHWIGNHSYTHSVPLGLRSEPGAAASEIGRTQELLGALSHTDRFFRPFGDGKLDRGLLNREAVRYLVDGRFTCVLWNCVPHDWDDPEGWVDRALGQCATQSWSLVVLHDKPTGAMDHLERFLDHLGETEAEMVQEFPPECVPIRRGNIILPMESYVAE